MTSSKGSFPLPEGLFTLGVKEITFLFRRIREVHQYQFPHETIPSLRCAFHL